MSIFNLDIVKEILKNKENARQLLLKPEKRIMLNLNVWLDDKTLIVTDAYVVYHNTARGPAKGGIRIDKNVTLEETVDLAERMTLKTALTGIPFGGGKSGIRIDNLKLSSYMKRAILQEFVHMIRDDLASGIYIPAPDLGTSPKEMAVIYGELHIPECVTGKPLGIGGLPGRKEATGRGVAFSTFYSAKNILKMDIKKMKIAIQGFGNVGSWTGYFLSKMGARIVAVSDITGGIYNSKGIDILKLMEYLAKGNPLLKFDGDKIKNEELLSLNVDILMPSAVENVLTKETAFKVRAKLIIESANGPTTEEGDEIVRKKGIPLIPDILANSGGVIASYIEWKSAKSGSMTSTEEVYEFIDKTIEKSFNKMLNLAKVRKLSYRESALCLAIEEVINAMENRGWI